MTTFQDAAGQDAIEYLEAYALPYLDAVQTAVNAGDSPDVIYRKVLREVGEHRAPLALRCKQAAAVLVKGQE